MPLLPPEPSLFPEDLLERQPEPDLGAGQWWVLHTRPRAEKALARSLRGRGIPFYLPLYARRWRSRGRTLSSLNPLFPGYVFLHGAGTERLAALETNLVARVLPVPDQPRLHDDLARVHRLLAAGQPVTPEERLEPGAAVVITQGPLAGLEGKVLSRRKHLTFLVEVQFLQRGVSAEIEGWMMQPLDSGRPAPAAARR